MILIAVIAVAIVASQVTFYLIHEKHISTVRASSAATLVFALLATAFPLALIPTLRAAFFGATFVGTTDKSRLGRKRVLIASFLFGLIFTFLIPFAQGIGGGLGTAAFVASSSTYLLAKLAKKYIVG